MSLFFEDEVFSTVSPLTLMGWPRPLGLEYTTTTHSDPIEAIEGANP
jgi:hypothetical protein